MVDRVGVRDDGCIGQGPCCVWAQRRCGQDSEGVGLEQLGEEVKEVGCEEFRSYVGQGEEIPVCVCGRVTLSCVEARTDDLTDGDGNLVQCIQAVGSAWLR